MTFAETTRLVALLSLGAALALPAAAASSTSSAVSDSIGTSVGSISDSFKRSSDSSSKDTKVTDGDYRVTDVAAVDDRPGTVRLTLQPTAAAGGQEAAREGRFFLYLPQRAIEQGQVAQGDSVTSRQRAYGVEFTKTATRQPFFLVLRDEWYRELPSNAVVL